MVLYALGNMLFGSLKPKIKTSPFFFCPSIETSKNKHYGTLCTQQQPKIMTSPFFFSSSIETSKNYGTLLYFYHHSLLEHEIVQMTGDFIRDFHSIRTIYRLVMSERYGFGHAQLVTCEGMSTVCRLH